MRGLSISGRLSIGSADHRRYYAMTLHHTPLYIAIRLALLRARLAK